MDDIADWRKKIDDIDERIAELLQRRAQCAVEIGTIKNNRGIEIYNPERERFIIERIRELGTGPLDGDALERIFGVIIDECKKSESHR